MSHVRKPKLIEQRLQQYAQYVVTDPVAARGSWRQHFARVAAGGSNPANATPTAPRLHLDLGCGKGLWTARVAATNPDALFVGADMERMCVSFAAERAGADHLTNALFTLDVASNVDTSFANGEVDVLHANFPTPFPRLKDAPKRVTDARQLMAYRRILGEDGLFCLKTDSQFMFDFTMDQLESAGYSVLWHTRDLHGEYEGHEYAQGDNAASAPTIFGSIASALERFNCGKENTRSTLIQLASAGPLPTDFVESAYERKLIAKGATVHVLHAIPSPAPENWAPANYVSLFDYLPEDLEQIAYAPLGMEDAIANMRNRQRNAQAKAVRKTTPAQPRSSAEAPLP